MNSTRLSRIFLILPALFISSAQAAVPGLQYTIQPLAGFELVEKNSPSPHTKLRFMYGARATGGYRMFAGEVEATRGTDREDFLNPLSNTQDQTDRVKLGIRSTRDLVKSGLVSVTLRAGGEASRTTHSETTNGVTTKNVSPIYCRPYIGTGVSTTLYKGFALNLEGVVVVDIHNLRNNAYQGTLSLQVPLYTL